MTAPSAVQTEQYNAKETQNMHSRWFPFLFPWTWQAKQPHDCLAASVPWWYCSIFLIEISSWNWLLSTLCGDGEQNFSLGSYESCDMFSLELIGDWDFSRTLQLLPAKGNVLYPTTPCRLLCSQLFFIHTSKSQFLMLSFFPSKTVPMSCFPVHPVEAVKMFHPRQAISNYEDFLRYFSLGRSLQANTLQ